MRSLMAFMLAFSAWSACAQELPPLREFVQAADAKTKWIEPRSQAGKGAGKLYERGRSFGADMRAAVQRAERAVQPYDALAYDPKALAVLSSECEAIANTVYRLYMYAHAKADILARTAGKQGGMDMTQADYNTAVGATIEARNSLDGLLKKSKEFRDELAKATKIPPALVLKQMTPEDLRRVLSNEGLRTYRDKNLIADATLETLLAAAPPAHKKDQPGRQMDGINYCRKECGIGDWQDCGKCARWGLENAEASYKYFRDEWNANNRWYQAWRRVELTDNLLGMLGARYHP